MHAHTHISGTVNFVRFFVVLNGCSFYNLHLYRFQMEFVSRVCCAKANSINFNYNEIWFSWACVFECVWGKMALLYVNFISISCVCICNAVHNIEWEKNNRIIQTRYRWLGISLRLHLPLFWIFSRLAMNLHSTSWHMKFFRAMEPLPPPLPLPSPSTVYVQCLSMPWAQQTILTR